MKTAKQTQSGANIPGLSYVPEFVSEHTACRLLEKVDQETWSSELKRRVQHYGYRYDYKARSVSKADKLGPLPSWLDRFITRHLHSSVLSERPDQVIANEYLPGQGISAHVDCIPCFSDTICFPEPRKPRHHGTHRPIRA
ncbi:MAG: DNA repair protein [Hyphomonadaceae bacterium]